MRHRSKTPIWFHVYLTFLTVTGGLSGVLIGALLIEAICGEDHYIYAGVKGFLSWLLIRE